MKDLNLKNIKEESLAPFRFKKLGDKYLITGDAGNFIFLGKTDWQKFLEGKLDKKSAVYKKLLTENFIRDELNLNKEIENYQKKKDFLFTGPNLHILVMTLRCDQKCVYCHASAQDMKASDKDMSARTAKAALQIIFATTSPFIAIEFQGGEPLVNWPIVKYVVQEARKRAKRFSKKLELRLVTNLNLMTEDKYKFLIDNKVSICTSFDGPKKVHDKNRPHCARGSNYESVFKWAKRFSKDYPKIKEKGYIWQMSGIAVISRHSLAFSEKIIDEYIEAGFKDIFFRPLNPFGFSQENWEEIKYSADEFIKFYKQALEYILELNFRGTEFRERLAKIFLTKILTSQDPNMMELRSPCGAGIGQLAYNYNGDVYTCDEGRMMSMMGDESFRLGNVEEDDYKKLVSSPVVRTLCTASCLEGLSGCSDCAYLPYCGVCPIYNYFTEGNLFSQMPRNERCKINMAILDSLFKKLQDQKARSVLERWVH